MTYSTLMAHIELNLANERLLGVTAALAERFHCKVIGIAASQPMQLLYGEVQIAGELVQLDRDEIEREITVAEEAFRTALLGKATSLDWRSTVTGFPLADYICHEARAADLIITSPDRGGVPFESTRRTDIGDLVLRCGRPVLIVPHAVTTLDAARVLVAWRETPEARRAIADAMPFLEQAKQVTVVEIAGASELADAEARTADVAAWLRGHGVVAEHAAIPAQGDIAHQLESIATQRNADLMVAGAYGHARLREWVFGGVTNDLLLRPRRCTLLSS
ncbi:MAG TPA: universal stress protein [Caulobacteraceae bacterium]|nr:universal stress protein [Caulobacteraceae bacterium]